ncbi:hypothetical protein [Flexivirga sp.]|uniref:hypothetical protein n=1 Tax=Flexivirga sp. TaxID=1962927 RepID=UPI003F80AB89
MRDTIRRGGSILIPPFALDRTEIVLRTLDDLTRPGSTAKVPCMSTARWRWQRG